MPQPAGSSSKRPITSDRYQEPGHVPRDVPGPGALDGREIRPTVRAAMQVKAIIGG
jgi:hypothetical protein